MTTVHVRMSRARVMQIIGGVAAKAAATSTVAAAATGAVAKRVQKAFLVKSRGATDECGHRWASLSPVTALKKLRKKEPTGDKLRPSSALSPQDRDQWWAYYRRALARHHDKSIAARIAWERIKRLDGVPLFDKYALVRSVGILRDTDTLLRSLSIGEPFNVMRMSSGRCDYGTRRIGASAHHTGSNVPQRRLWPPPKDWSKAWWQNVLNEARDEIVTILLNDLR